MCYFVLPCWQLVAADREDDPCCDLPKEIMEGPSEDAVGAADVICRGIPLRAARCISANTDLIFPQKAEGYMPELCALTCCFKGNGPSGRTKLECELEVLLRYRGIY